MFTKCPSCKTVFNLKPEQLNTAHGKVRCSRCQTIFNARENLFTPGTQPEQAENKTAGKTSAQIKSSERPHVAAKPATKTAPPTPPADKRKTAASAPPSEKEQGIAADSTADEWFDLTPTPTAKPDSGQQSPARPVENTAPPSQPPSIEEELNDDLFKLFAEPEQETTASLSVEPETESQGNVKKGKHRDEIVTAAGKTNTESEETAKIEGAAGTSESALTTEKEQPDNARPVPDSYSLPPQLESRPVRATLKTLFYALSNLMLVVALVLQYAYDHRIPLRENETWRPWLDTLCQISDCPMPPKRDLQKIELVDNMMQSHPRYQNSLLVTATLINRADFVQPYPIVEITMTDLQQHVVAQRTFQPKEYLAGDIAEMGFTPNVEVALMLEMADPGDNAVGFKFDFF